VFRLRPKTGGGKLDRAYEGAIAALVNAGLGSLLPDLKRAYEAHLALINEAYGASEESIRAEDLASIAAHTEAFSALIPFARATRVDQPAAANDQEDKDSPPETLLAELSRKEQAIVRYLWHRRSVDYSQFVAAIWKNSVNPETPAQAIKRLNRRLLGLGQSFAITRKGDYITLDRPDKKRDK
jgi:hypothetical protein